MPNLALGDTTRTLTLAKAMARAKTDIARQSQDLATGQISDPSRQLRAGASALAHLDHRIAQAQATQTAAQQALTRLTSQDAALQAIHDTVQGVAETLLRPELFATDDRLDPTAAQVEQAFGAVVGFLNTQASGRSLFAGMATDGPALAGGSAMLDQLAALVPPGGDKATLDGIVAAWFAPAGGFDTSGFLGGAPDPGVQLDATFRLPPAPTASDQPMRDMLATLAKGALLARIDAPAQTKRAVLAEIGLMAQRDAAGLRGIVEQTGLSLARLDELTVRQQAVATAAQVARNDLAAADPYQTATALQDSIARLEQVLAVTARLSRLSLGHFL